MLASSAPGRLEESAVTRRPARLYPDFLIVGVMKAATTSLSNYLSLHPNIHIPPDEIHFFNRDDRYRKGIRYYQGFFNPVGEEYLVGEKGPTYSYDEKSAARIAAFNPNMKLIWIFRNPTRRAYSHYWYFVQNGQERHSFERAIELEPARRKANIGYSYVDRGIYIRQIERYREYFPRDQMLFLLYEEYARNPSPVVERCQEFLKVSNTLVLPRSKRRRNVTHLPRSVHLQWLAYRYLYYRFPLGYRIVSRLNRNRTGGYPALSEETKKRLDDFYRPYNEQFAAETGLDISCWQ